MSAATAEIADAPPPKAGRKKLIILAAAAVLLLAVAGGAAFLLLKKAPELDEDGEEVHGKAATAQVDKHKKDEKIVPPVFVPLDPFTVNLADKESERYAQVGITLEIEDNKFGDQLKLYMPAIRNNILMVLSHKTAAELATREGKEALAQTILRESLRPLGIQVAKAAEEEPEDSANDAPKKKKKARKAPPPVYPIKAVHFSNFIIQ
jgi:flagellar protein FliL